MSKTGTRKKPAVLCGANTVQCLTCGKHRREHRPGGEAPACAFVAKRCERTPSKGKRRCLKHGGKSLEGPAHPNYQTGRHSKFLQLGLARRYQDSMNDPRLIGLRDEIALVDVRITQLLDAVGKTGNATAWDDAWAKFSAFKASAGKGKAAVGASVVALKQLEDVLMAGRSEAATWVALADCIDLRRKLVEGETKRQRDLRQLVTLEQAIGLIGILLDEVKQRVTDRQVLADISAVCVRLLGAGGGAAIES